MGFGVSYDIGYGKLQAEGRYVYSFGNIQQSLLVTRTSQPRNLQISIGYLVSLNDILNREKKPKKSKEVTPAETITEDSF